MNSLKWSLMRLAAAVFALTLASTAGAAMRYWYLQNVAFNDGTTVSGSFAYDDVTQQVGSWSVRVKAGAHFLPFTYLPGNSVAYTDVGDFSVLPTIVISSSGGAGGAVAQRQVPDHADDGARRVADERSGRHRDGWGGQSGSIGCASTAGRPGPS